MKAGGPSDKAVEAAITFPDPADMDPNIREALGRAHDPALGLDRSVCLRDVVENLRGMPKALHPNAVADFIEQRLGGSDDEI